jgi:integrase
MSAWIESRKRGWFRVRWRKDGKKFASHVFFNRADAEQKLSEISNDLSVAKEASGSTRGVALSIDAMLVKWAASRSSEGGVRPSYIQEVTAQITKLSEALEWKNVRDITAESIDRWRSSIPNGKGTDKPLASVKSVLNWARRSLRQPVDATVLTIPPRKRPRKLPPTLMNDAEFSAVLARAKSLAGERVSLLLECLGTYAWRPIDACKLECGSVDVGGITLKATKNGDAVRHPLLPEHAARLCALAADRKPEEKLFLDPLKREWRISKLGQAEGLSSWYKVNIGEAIFAEGSGRTGIYCLKDRAISAMEDAGIDDRTKASFTGHRTLRVFDHYRATNPQRALAALTKLKSKMKKKAAPKAPTQIIVNGAQERN